MKRPSILLCFYRNAYRLLLGDEETTDEDGEVVAIAFGELPAGVTGGTPPITNVGIYDSVREVVVSFDAGTYTVAEGEMVAVTVSLDMDPQRQVLIPLTKTEQSGIAGSDYGGLPAIFSHVRERRDLKVLHVQRDGRHCRRRRRERGHRVRETASGGEYGQRFHNDVHHHRRTTIPK